MAVWVEIDLCNGCKRCLNACPYGAVEVTEGKAHIQERCTSCGACLQACKQEALQSDSKPKEVPDFRDRQGVWVFAEQRDGNMAQVSLELLGRAQSIAGELKQDVSAVLLGFNISGLAQTLIDHGANRVYLADGPVLEGYRTNAYTKVIEDLVREHRPNILLMGATHIGRDLAPRVSRRIGVGLTADCTELTIDPGEGILLQTRPAFGGNVMATIASRYSRPQMATVRPGVMEPLRRPNQRGEVIHCRVKVAEREIGTRVLEKVEGGKKRVNLAEAKVIIAGGRGVGDAKGFGNLEQLAALLGAEVAGTRVAVEEGWIPSDRQVGQTGQSVRPEIYVACGISGAIQHRAGMSGSRYVIAINKDRRAPIFQVADWGIVGDLQEVVPAMIEEIKRGREG